MPAPYLETVIKALVEELGRVNEANGYASTLGRITRYDSRKVTSSQPLGISYAEVPCGVVAYTGGERELRGDTWHATAGVTIYAFTAPIPADGSPDSTDEAVLLLEDDVFRACAKVLDPQGGYQGAVLESFSAVALEEEDESGYFDGVICRLQVHFKHPFQDTVNAYV